MKFADKKRCPRCGKKVLSEVGVCPQCKLNYAKFFSATNKEAKIALKRGEKESVIYRKGIPSDVSKLKLLLLTVFLGFCGGHLYYIGRKNLGIFYSVFFCVGLAYAIISAYTKFNWNSEVGQFLYILVLVWGVVLIMWIVDIVKVCFNRFKIPVSLKRS